MTAYIRLARPKQWVKNFFVFAGAIFARRMDEPSVALGAGIAFAAFCLVSSAVYALNDLVDLPRDRVHPEKRMRPVASGQIKPASAGLFSAALLLTALLVAAADGWRVAALIAAYAAVNLAYSLGLKDVVILDVFLVASGFVLRVLAGTWAIGIRASHWLLLCTFLLSLFLGFAKRRHEAVMLGDGKSGSRKVLSSYSPLFLDQMLAVITPSVLLTYVLYTVDAETVAKYGSERLMLTTPFVMYGIFRYQYQVYERNEGDPTATLYRDPTLALCVAAWLALFLALTL